tara:strand:+ start:910 stop:1110 length:201 start_codon:yes stop_codon:yes gene_type:complete
MSKMGQYVLERDEILEAAFCSGISHDDFATQCKARQKHPYDGTSLDWAWEVLKKMKEDLNASADDR